MAEAWPDGTDQPAEETAAGAAARTAASPALLSDQLKQAQLIASERQYQQGVQAIRVRTST